MPLDLSRVQGVFQLAAEQSDPEARQRVLDEQCAGKPLLRARVEQLLRAHDQPQPLPGPAPAAGQPARSMPHAGAMIAGRYKLLELLGEGGMGAVWVAEQSAPIRRRVALKLIKPGMDSKQVLSRFEAERQALALMDHPNIAKVYDGSMTEEGRPYFAMEYVKGVPITDYCDQAKLPVFERIKLFVPVCQAVQHAHQKGVIHRDLKPSNILVCLYDGVPIPKVIDFGLAKATSQPLTEHTLYTAHGLMVGTPLYMSPEQAEFNNLDVDTRTDIYSLGVILYELLTGTTPLEKQRFKDATLVEILRIIKEDEPQRPSTKVSTSATLPTLAAQRSVDPAQLSRQVRGELDWIVMKSLDKERSRRYETANGLARDLERFLADEPVEACPPSLGYRFRKALRRNKKWFSLGVASLLVLFTLTGAIGWVLGDRWNRQAKVEYRARAILAEARLAAEAGDVQTAEQAVTQAEGLLATVDPNQELSATIRSWKADFELVRQLEAADRQLAETVYDEAAQHREWATAYARVFEGNGFDPVRLNRQEAIDWLQASPLRRSLAGAVDVWAMHTDPEGRDRLLDILREADPPAWRNRLRDALVRDDLSALKQLAGDKDRRGQPPRLVILLESSLSKHGERTTAVELLRDALQAHPRDYWLNLHLGHLLLETRGEQAIVPARAAVATAPNSAAARNLLGGVYCLSLQPSGAEAHFREAIRLQPNYGVAQMNLAYVLGEQKKYSEGLTVCERAMQLLRQDPYVHLQHGNLLRLQGNTRQANDALRKALALAPDDWLVNGNFLSQFKLRSTKLHFVEECRDELKNPQADPRWRRWMAEMLRYLEQLQESEAAYRDFLRAKPNDALAQYGLIVVLLKLNRVTQAEAVCEEMRQTRPGDVVTDLCHTVILASKRRDAEAEKATLRVLQKEPYVLGYVEMALVALRRQRGDSATLPSPLVLRIASNEGGPVYRDGRWLWMTLARPDLVENPAAGTSTSPLAGTSQDETKAQDDVERNPNSAKAHVTLGWVKYRRRKYSEADAMVSKALDLDSRYADAFVLRGFVQRARRQYDAAERSFDSALKLDPHNAGAHQGLALVYDSQGKHEQAEAAAKKAVELNPGNPDYYYDLASILERRGKWAEAAEAFRQELNLRPERATSRNDYGWVLQRVGKVAEAQQEFAEARRLAPTVTHLSLGSDYAGMGRFWQAAQHYLIDFKEHSRSEDSAARAALLQLLDGDRTGYEETCRQMLERFAESADPVTAQTVWHTCALAQPAVGSPEQLRALAQRAANKDGPERTASVLAVWAIRQGHWQETLEQCRISRDAKDASTSPGLRSQALILEAIARHHLEKPVQAKAAYYEAARQSHKLSPYAPYQPGTQWFDWAHYELPRREAAALLGIPDELWDRQGPHRAHLAVCSGDWKKAAEELTAWCRDPRGDSTHWMRIPALHLLAGDTEAYRQQCEAMRIRFAASELWEDHERVCKTCVLLPGFDKSVLPIAKFTEPLEQGTSPQGYVTYGYASWAIVAYRNGDLRQAIEAAEKVAIDPKSTYLPLTQSLFLLALSHRKLGESEAADRYAQRAHEQLGTPLLPIKSDGTVDVQRMAQQALNWWDAYIVELLRKEFAELPQE